MSCMQLSRFASAVFVGLAFTLAAPIGVRAAAETGSWAERVQVVYDPQDRSVSRVLLRVWDRAPAQNLEFTFEPDPHLPFRPAADGTIEGRGKLIWRVRGAAPHDRRAIHSTYVGMLASGRPHGIGRLETREGEVFDGNWVAGELDGQGERLDRAGNRYTGDFRRGRPHGRGRETMADGSIYEGAFRNGDRHGEGTMRLAGGAVYASVWRDGVEVGGNRPDIVADATLGGLIRAQSGGGDAGKVSLSVTVDQRMTQQSDLRYVHGILDDQIEIYPENAGMVDAWTGQAPIVEYGYEGVFDYIDWEDAPSFWQVRFETEDGSRVELDRLELQVDDSQVYRKPFLSVVGHRGCVGYRPGFSLQNNGWGPVANASYEFQFYNVERPEEASRTFSAAVPNFDEGGDISVETVLAAAGVDTRGLAEGRFSCSSQDEMPACRRDVVASVGLGELAPLVESEASDPANGTLEVGLRGRLRYQWADDRGNIYDADEAMEAGVQLAVISTELMVAEGGDGWSRAPEALRYQVVELPDDRQDYAIDLPVRGNRKLASYVALLKVYAGHNSYHRFTATALFADGSIRKSKPVSYFHIRPRMTYYDPPEPAGGCYLDPSYTPPRKSG